MAHYDPLLRPGIHLMTESQVEAVAVTSYPSSTRRPMLYQGLMLWLAELRALGVSGKCWLDGSFFTHKPEPSDIDLLVFPDPVALTPAQQSAVVRLLDNGLMKAQYCLDVYVLDLRAANAQVQAAYWRGWYGFCRDQTTAKGIAEVTL